MEIIKKLVMSALVILLHNVNTKTRKQSFKNKKKERKKKKRKEKKNNSCENFVSPDTGMSTATPRAALPSLTSVQCAVCVCVWGGGDGDKKYVRISMWSFNVYDGTIKVAPAGLAVQTMYLCLNW